MSTTVFTVGKARFSVISDGVIRMEYSNGAFVDEPTLLAERDYTHGAEYIVSDVTPRIKTSLIELDYTDDGKPFSKNNLKAKLNISGKEVEWKFGDENRENLGGAVVTLDGCCGTNIPVPEGIIARDGWHVVDDSGTNIIRDGWIAKRPEEHVCDIYLFVYGTDYKKALRDFANVSGKALLPRKYTFGSWYSRWYPYTSDDFRAIVDDYEEHGLPLDILVVDMDWHHHDWQTPPEHPGRAHFGFGHAGGNMGWTGYSFNEKLIPDPDKFLKDIHAKGIAVSFNDHPADGLRDSDDSYPAFADALGLDKENGENLPFLCGDRKYMDAFFSFALGDVEKRGVDFWWLDWQQDGIIPHVPGFENQKVLPWINRIYYENSRKNGKRGENYSRWGGLGDQKHPMYFSGDSVALYETLKFEIENTAASSNSMCFWWGHDIGGFSAVDTERNPELYIRWVQFGITTAAVKLHSAGDENLDKRPWTWGVETCERLRQLFLLRSRLLPAIYSAAARCYFDSLPFNMPLYYEYPELEEAYCHPTEYFLSDKIVCAPVYEAGEGDDKIVTQDIWLPDGVWYDFFTNKKYEGHCTIESSLDTFPLFFKAGAPIPMQRETTRMTSAPLDELIIRIYMPENGSDETFSLYEDDGISEGYMKGEYLFTEIRCTRNDDIITVSLTPSGKAPENVPVHRKVTIELTDENADISLITSEYETSKPHSIEIKL